MGLPPDHPDYEPGEDCLWCHDVLFGGVTPKYVEADVSGIVKCPGVVLEPPQGTFLLTQKVNPCFWRYEAIGFFIEWWLEQNRSSVLIWEAGFWWFSAGPEHACFDAFVNNNICNGPPAIGEDGYVLLYWGPTIGP